MIEILVAILIGICLGVFTGMTPGVHINLLAAVILSFMHYVSLDSLVVSSAIFSMAVTHTFIDIIPSVYLGAPDEAMALNVLPAHRLLLEGKGHFAVLISMMGSFTSMILTILLFVPLVYLIKIIYLGKYYFKYIILIVIIVMLLNEKRRVNALIVFFLSGILGYVALSTSSQPFFHLFTGFFGISMLLEGTSVIPMQKIGGEIVKISPRLNVFSFLSGIITGIFPGTTNSTSAVFFPVKENYLYYVSGINTSSMLISLGTFYAIEKARNGIVISISNLLSQIPLLLFLSISIISGSIALIMGIFLSKKIVALMKKINYDILRKVIIIFLLLISFYFDGFYGLIILLVSTSVALVSNVKRSFMLGCILLPLIMYYFT